MASGTAARGVIIDGAGIGSSMAANKVPGIRAALCYDKASARNSREHNDSNVLTLGARLLTESQAEEVLRTWLATPFAGGRHQARVDKIIAHRAAVPEEGTPRDANGTRQPGRPNRRRNPGARRPTGLLRAGQKGRGAQPARPGLPRLRAALRRKPAPAIPRRSSPPAPTAFRPASASRRSIPPSPRSSITPSSSPKPPAPTSSRSAARPASTASPASASIPTGCRWCAPNWPARRSRSAPWSASRWAPPAPKPRWPKPPRPCAPARRKSTW